MLFTIGPYYGNLKSSLRIRPEVIFFIIDQTTQKFLNFRALRMVLGAGPERRQLHRGLRPKGRV